MTPGSSEVVFVLPPVVPALNGHPDDGMLLDNVRTRNFSVHHPRKFGTLLDKLMREAIDGRADWLAHVVSLLRCPDQLAVIKLSHLTNLHQTTTVRLDDVGGRRRGNRGGGVGSLHRKDHHNAIGGPATIRRPTTGSHLQTHHATGKAADPYGDEGRGRGGEGIYGAHPQRCLTQPHLFFSLRNWEVRMMRFWGGDHG